jgi:hypothetical protein
MTWNCFLSRIAKSTAATTINDVTATSCHFSTQPGSAGASDTLFAAQLSACQAMAVAALAALTGAALNVDVRFGGTTDHSTSAALPMLRRRGSAPRSPSGGERRRSRRYRRRSRGRND